MTLFDQETPVFTDRHEAAQWMRARADTLTASIGDAIRSYSPMGIASEFSVASGARPRRGVCVGTPFGTYVFARARCPRQGEVDEWNARYSEADKLRIDAIAVDSWIGLPDPGTVTGNRAHCERMVALAAEWGATDDERDALDTLTAFWSAHPDAKYGVMSYDGRLVTNTDPDV